MLLLGFEKKILTWVFSEFCLKVFFFSVTEQNCFFSLISLKDLFIAFSLFLLKG